MQDYARQTVTMEPHPHLSSHHASVHPCKVRRVFSLYLFCSPVCGQHGTTPAPVLTPFFCAPLQGTPGFRCTFSIIGLRTTMEAYPHFVFCAPLQGTPCFSLYLFRSPALGSQWNHTRKLSHTTPLKRYALFLLYLLSNPLGGHRVYTIFDLIAPCERHVCASAFSLLTKCGITSRLFSSRLPLELSSYISPCA